MAFLWFLRAPLYRVLFRFKKFFEFSTLSGHIMKFVLIDFGPEGKKFGTRSWRTDVVALGPS